MTRMMLSVLRRLRRNWRLTTLSVIVMAVAWTRLGPLPDHLLDRDARPSTIVTDRHGEPLYEARSSLGLRSEELDAAALPASLVAATLAAEDARFRRHPGVDPVAIVRALVRN